MKAIVYRRYGSADVLGLEDVERPALRDDGVLIRVLATSVNRSDWEGLTGSPAYVRFSGSGLWKPKRSILGSDVAGRVEAVGRDVTEFQPGDEVLADTLWHGAGGFAEYVSIPDHAPLVHKPATITFEQAAALPQAAVLGLQGLQYRGGVQPGEAVLINGAGGGGGTFAIQIAKSLGAEVTGVDNTAKLDTMRSVGADHVIDYTRENFAKDGHRYDRILDFAAHRSLLAYKRVLRKGGIYAMVGGSMPRLLQVLVVGSIVSRIGSKKMGLLVARPNKDDLAYVAGLLEDGTVTAVIDHRRGLSEVPQALRDLGAGRLAGKAVITV